MGLFCLLALVVLCGSLVVPTTSLIVVPKHGTPNPRRHTTVHHRTLLGYASSPPPNDTPEAAAAALDALGSASAAAYKRKKSPPLSTLTTSGASSSPTFNCVEDATNFYPDFIPHPNPTFTALDVVTTCMNAFVDNEQNEPTPKSYYNTDNDESSFGLEVCFYFSSDKCRAATGRTLPEYKEYAQNPTFAHLTECASYDVLAVGPVIPGTLHRGAMQTVLIAAHGRRRDVSPSSSPTAVAPPSAAIASVTSTKDEHDDSTSSSRKFLWTLQQERRPPLQGCWTIHEVLYTKNAWQQTL